jgi:hypothetical protein
MFSLLDLTFHSTFLFLVGSSVITASEMFTPYHPSILPLKYVLSLETAVTVIAAFAYNNLIQLMSQPHHPNIIAFRYLDWYATTPLLLLSFIIYLNYLTNKAESVKNPEQPNLIKLDYGKIFIILVLNFLMLTFGYLGENKFMNHTTACIIGFIPFIAMIYLLWIWYRNESNNMIFNIFTVVWALYGIVYFLPTIWKNLSYNTLDIIAKVGFGFLVWYELIQRRLTNPKIQ